MGGGLGNEWKALYIINCYNPANNSWHAPVNTPYCNFNLLSLNNKLLTAGGWDKRYLREVIKY